MHNQPHHTHYAELGVERSASSDEIKAAYRKLARKYHPDVSKETDAAEKIKSINEAYAVLGDQKKREAYDHSLEGRRAPEFGGGSFHGDIHDLFESLFGRRNQRAITALSLSLEQAFRGGEFSIQAKGKTAEISIPPGIGHGDTLKHPELGELEIRYIDHPRFQSHDGHIMGEMRVPPWIIALGGKLTVDTLGGPVEATLPAGLREGQRIRLPGRGMPANDARGARDHWGVVKQSVPMATTDAQRKIYQDMAKAFGDDAFGA